MNFNSKQSENENQYTYPNKGIINNYNVIVNNSVNIQYNSSDFSYSNPYFPNSSQQKTNEIQNSHNINYVDTLDTNENNNSFGNSNLINFNNYNTNFTTDFYLRRPPLEIINEMKSEYSHDSAAYKRPLSKQDNEYLLNTSKNRFFPSSNNLEFSKNEV